MKKILVIDGNSIINRAFYGIRILSTKSGKFTNAIYGMVNIITKQLDAIKPDYCAVAFDVKHPTFRHEMYVGYKAGRHPTPPELISQFPDAKECLDLMGIKVLELPGWEADDIQGTIAKMAHLEKDTEKRNGKQGDPNLAACMNKQIDDQIGTCAEEGGREIDKRGQNGGTQTSAEDCTDHHGIGNKDHRKLQQIGEQIQRGRQNRLGISNIGREEISERNYGKGAERDHAEECKCKTPRTARGGAGHRVISFHDKFCCPQFTTKKRKKPVFFVNNFICRRGRA